MNINESSETSKEIEYKGFIFDVEGYINMAGLDYMVKEARRKGELKIMDTREMTHEELKEAYRKRGLIITNIKRMDNENFNHVTDGYHTFEELYFHRMILFSVICKQNPGKAWKSKLHADGSMFENYFIVGIETQQGQYTYHYHMEHWGHFDGVEEFEKAPAWDGHKQEDITRLLKI